MVGPAWLFRMARGRAEVQGRQLRATWLAEHARSCGCDTDGPLDLRQERGRIECTTCGRPWTLRGRDDVAYPDGGRTYRLALHRAQRPRRPTHRSRRHEAAPGTTSRVAGASSSSGTRSASHGGSTGPTSKRRARSRSTSAPNRWPSRSRAASRHGRLRRPEGPRAAPRLRTGHTVTHERYQRLALGMGAASCSEATRRRQPRTSDTGQRIPRSSRQIRRARSSFSSPICSRAATSPSSYGG